MPYFSERSKNNLSEVHDDLQRLMNRAIEQINFTIIEGRRSKKEQNQYYENGKSTLQYPHSKHNAMPSLAVDIAPYPIDFQERERFYFQVGHITGLAEEMGIPIRVGMDWDGDYRLVPHDDDESFLDLPHIELDIPYNENVDCWPE
jgi:peptidoglycan L-alanyl-D-glutamate endopeptidase CwlK